MRHSGDHLCPQDQLETWAASLKTYVSNWQVLCQPYHNGEIGTLLIYIWDPFHLVCALVSYVALPYTFQFGFVHFCSFHSSANLNNWLFLECDVKHILLLIVNPFRVQLLPQLTATGNCPESSLKFFFQLILQPAALLHSWLWSQLLPLQSRPSKPSGASWLTHQSIVLSFVAYFYVQLTP